MSWWEWKGPFQPVGCCGTRHSQVVPPGWVTEGTDKAPACCFVGIAVMNRFQTKWRDRDREQLSSALSFCSMVQPIRSSLPSGGMHPRLSCFKRTVFFLIWSGDGREGVTTIAQISHHRGPVQRVREKDRCKYQVLPAACHPAAEEPFQSRNVHAEPKSRLTSFSWAGCDVDVFWEVENFLFGVFIPNQKPLPLSSPLESWKPLDVAAAHELSPKAWSCCAEIWSLASRQTHYECQMQSWRKHSGNLVFFKSKPMVFPTNPTTYWLDSPDWLPGAMSLVAQPIVFTVAIGHDGSLLLCFAPAAENLPLTTAICVQPNSVGYSGLELNAFPPPLWPASVSVPLLVVQGWRKASLIPREL